MTLGSLIRQMIEQGIHTTAYTSANPVHTNYAIDGTTRIVEQDFEQAIENAIREKLESMKTSEGGEGGGEEGGGGTSVMMLGGAKKGLGMAKGGVAGMGGMTLSRLAAMAGPVGIAITAALLAPEIAKFVLGLLTQPGGPWDTRFRREISTEVEFYLNRQEQKNTAIGNRQVIISAQAGFKNFQGDGHANTFRQIVEGVNGGQGLGQFPNGLRQANIGLTDKASGLKTG